MNKFSAIQTFARVAEHGGFTAASKVLGTSVSAITKTIARLEDDLGIRLFQRTTRRFALTDAGHEFYERSVRILNELSDAEDTVRQTGTLPKGCVRAAVPLSFGRTTLIPELPKFYAKYPEVSLHLTFSDRPLDILHEGFDVAVRTGSQSDSRLIKRSLTRGPEVTFASPAYLSTHGTPKAPDDLHAHNCIVSRFGPDWSFRTPQGGKRTIRVSGNLTVLSGDAVQAAALAGVGIAHANWWLVRRELASGALVPVLRDCELPGAPVSLLYPANRHLPAKVRAFIDFVAEITDEAPQFAAAPPRTRRRRASA
jgi:DNA-binding transcriptional LysR family regulator